MKIFYRYFNYLSLDVAIGATVLSSTISNHLTGIVNWNISTCLGLAVWIIYTFDHIRDAYKSAQIPSISRHFFHKQYSKKIIISLLIAIIIEAYFVSALPSITIWLGFALLGFVIVYFLIVYAFKGFYLKEVFAAVMYATGVFINPLSNYSILNEFQAVTIFIQTLVIAFTNLTLFSLIEYNLDIKDNHSSLVRKIGKKNTAILLEILFWGLLFFQIFVFFSIECNLFQFGFLLMTIVLTGVFLCYKYLLENEEYRWIGDAIFFIPAIELLY